MTKNPKRTQAQRSTTPQTFEGAIQMAEQLVLAGEHSIDAAAARVVEVLENSSLTEEILAQMATYGLKMALKERFNKK